MKFQSHSQLPGCLFLLKVDLICIQGHVANPPTRCLINVGGIARRRVSCSLGEYYNEQGNNVSRFQFLQCFRFVRCFFFLPDSRPCLFSVLQRPIRIVTAHHIGVKSRKLDNHIFARTCIYVLP